MRRVLFLTLTTFSKTGGIEKFNRSFSKALHELSLSEKQKSSVSSVYDSICNEKYFAADEFYGYNGNRWWFIIKELRRCRLYDEIIFGHINLALLLVLVKLFYPSKKLILILHGIEVMEPLAGIKRKALNKCNEAWAVSEFTRQNIIQQQQQPAEKVKIFYNTIDPLFRLPQQFNKPAYLQQRYNLTEGEKVLLTVTRLNHKENYKGYDKVIAALPAIKKIFPLVRYIIAGDGDETEKEKLTQQINTLGLGNNVVLAGYVPDEELTDYFLLSDVFVMPSSKEGFGIVFIEALTCGVSVIGGNKDGTVDALDKGSLGTLVNPDSIEEITVAIIDSLKKSNNSIDNTVRKNVQQKVISSFGFEAFKKRLSNYLSLNN